MANRLTAFAHLANELTRMTIDMGELVAAVRPRRLRYYEDHF